MNRLKQAFNMIKLIKKLNDTTWPNILVKMFEKS